MPTTVATPLVALSASAEMATSWRKMERTAVVSLGQRMMNFSCRHMNFDLMFQQMWTSVPEKLITVTPMLTAPTMKEFSSAPVTLDTLAMVPMIHALILMSVQK